MSIDKWGDIVWASMRYSFEGCSNMTLADNAGVPDLTMVTSIRDTFDGATSFNGNISNWDVSNVTSMWNIFNGATSFNGDLSNWNVSNVTNMNQMFHDATSFNGDLSNWNVSNATSMWNTFNGASSFNGDLSTWNVSNVTSMLSTFEGATSFNRDLSSWNVSNVTDMAGTFFGATNFNGDLSSWNVSNVIYMAGTFWDATSFNSDISSWDVSNVIVSNPLLPSFPGMTNIFKNATSFSSENYDALLTEWAKLTLQDDITFGAPPTTYCSGEAGRDILINTYNWTIQGDNGLSCPIAQDAPFVTTWNTELGDPGNATIELPITVGAYDVDVNNDGDFDDAEDKIDQTGTITIDFTTAGEYTIAVRPNPTNNASKQLRISHYDIVNGQIGTPVKLTSIDKWGDIVWTSIENAFRGCSNMTLADDAGVPDLTMVTSMSSTFSGATSFNGDLSTWNVSNVISMWATFDGATSFNGNISNWNVSNVTNMLRTFSDATSFDGDLSDWNVSNVIYMQSTFAGATSFNGNISNWDVSNVANMFGTFSGATSFNGDLSTWNVSNVTNMVNTFLSAESFNGNISNWDVSNVADMTATFEGATSFNGNISNWDVSNVTGMAGTFFEATNFNGDLSTWNVSNVTDMAGTFGFATNFNGDLSSWNVSNVIYMAGTFWDATSFNGDISSWDVSNVVVLNPLFPSFPGMTDIFKNATSFSSENYDALLTEWAKLTLQDDIPFTAPPTTYCSGKAGRDILINTYNWTIQGDNGLDCPVAPVAPFVTTWNTELGDPGNATIVLPITEGAYDVDANNDGDFDDSVDFTNQTGGITIDFVTPGIYTIAVRPNPTNNTSKQLRISHDSSGDTPEKLMSIDKWGDIVWTSMASAFEDCSNMILADDAGVPDLTMVTSMWNAFNGATSFNGDLSSWNVSNVTIMFGTFSGATSFNGNVSSWNVSNVISMAFTFYEASSFNGDLSTWNVSNVTDMDSMFDNAINFNGNISSWNVSNVGDMRDAFQGATSFNGDLSTWNVSNVATMLNTFNGATSFNGNISSWDVSNVTDMDSMFYNATNFNGNISSWNVSNVEDMREAFQGATSFNGDLSSWNVSNVRFMTSTFSGATSFSSENYDALLTGWSNLTPQNNITFGAPPTTYCAGKAGRDILINTYNWTITGDNGEDCSPVTSVDEEFLSNTKIYPNPTNGKINIESSFEIDKLELYNVLGAKLFSVSKTNALDLTSLRQGVYILKVFSEDRVISKKIIKD